MFVCETLLANQSIYAHHNSKLYVHCARENIVGALVNDGGTNEGSLQYHPYHGSLNDEISEIIIIGDVYLL